MAKLIENIRNSPKAFFLPIFSLSLVAGVFLNHYFNHYTFLYVLFALAVFFLIIGIKIRYLLILPIIFMGIFFGFLRASNVNDERIIDKSFIGKKVEVIGYVTEEPDVRESHVRYVITAESIKYQDSVLDLTVKIIITSEFYPRYSFGDKVRVKGKLVEPENFTTDTGREFDYIHYLAKDRIYYMINFAEIKKVSDEIQRKYIFRRTLYNFKKKIVDSLNLAIPQPESALASGITLGTKQALGSDLKNKYIDTGLIHIVVLSGYNVSIVAEGIMKMLVFLPAAVSFFGGILSITLFAIMVGGGATIMRASIMALLVLTTRFFGSGYNIDRSIIYAGSLMIIVNPKILFWDISFHMSFIATLGLVYLAPRIVKWFLWIPKKFGFRDIVVSSLAAQISVIPYILYVIGKMSVVSPIANILVLPIIPISMFLTALTGIIGIFSSSVASIFGLVTYLPLKYTNTVVETLSRLSFSSFIVGEARSEILLLISTVITYFLLAVFVFKTKPSNEMSIIK